MKWPKKDELIPWLKRHKILVGAVVACLLLVAVEYVRTNITGKNVRVAGKIEYSTLSVGGRHMYLVTDAGKKYWLKEVRTHSAGNIYNFGPGDRVVVRGWCRKAGTQKVVAYGPGGVRYENIVIPEDLTYSFPHYLMRVDGVHVDVGPWLKALEGQTFDYEDEGERLARLGGREILGPLIARLKDHKGKVRLAMEHALGEITGEAIWDDPDRWEEWWKRNKDVYQ